MRVVLLVFLAGCIRVDLTVTDAFNGASVQRLAVLPFRGEASDVGLLQAMTDSIEAELLGCGIEVVAQLQTQTVMENAQDINYDALAEQLHADHFLIGGANVTGAGTVRGGASFRVIRRDGTVVITGTTNSGARMTKFGKLIGTRLCETIRGAPSR